MVAVLRSTQLGLVLLARCNSADRSGDVPVSQARDVHPVAQLAYRYSYRFRPPSRRLAEAQRRHVAMCERLGPRP